MAWVYLDDHFPDHPKVAMAGGDAAWMFVCGLAYARRHETAGRIPKAQVERLTDRRKPAALAARLVEVDLWEDDGEFFVVHDYHDWNKPQESRSAAGRKAAQARWAKERAHANGNANASETHERSHEIADASGCPPPRPHPITTSDPPTTSRLGHANGGGGDPIAAVIEQAATLVATAEAARRGTEIGNPAGYVRARTPAIRNDHDGIWRRLLNADPTLTADELVTAGRTLSPEDRTGAAQRERIALTERRRNGATCPQCDDQGVTELDDGTFTDCPCKTRRTA